MQISSVKPGARVQSSAVQGSYNISAIEQNVVVEKGILEDDSHADTCLVGKGFRVVNDHGHSAEVEGFTDEIGMSSCKWSMRSQWQERARAKMFYSE